MKILCSEKMPEKIKKILLRPGYSIVNLPPFGELDPPVASHPDMLCSVMPDGTVLIDARYYRQNKETLSGIKIKSSTYKIGRRYPADIGFDVILNEGVLFGLVGYIAPELIEVASRVINVKQGYTLCSTLIFKSRTEDYHCAVTADSDLASRMEEEKIRVLKISPGEIVLDGYNCGFIGGASGVLPCGDIVFFGDISSHTDGVGIIRFCEENGYGILFERNIPLSDFGGIKVVT